MLYKTISQNKTFIGISRLPKEKNNKCGSTLRSNRWKKSPLFFVLTPSEVAQ